MKVFALVSHDFEHLSPEVVTEETAPKWLKGDGKGSTMDNRWFWNDHVLTLEIGEYVDTDFRRVTRIA